MTKSSALSKLPASTLMACAALSVLAMALLVAGLLGLMQPQLVPALANPALSWPLIAVGGMLESGSVTLLLSVLRQQRSQV